jgi:hypothetical protein
MATILFLRTESLRHDGRSCRDYAIHDAGGALRFVARAFRVPGPFTACAAHAPDRPILLAKPRRSFPLTGRYDVRGAGGESLGVVTRSGRFQDADGRELGRFVDARSWKEHAGEAALTGILEGVILGAGDTGAGSGPRAYVVTIGDRRAGMLSRAPVPFDAAARPAVPPGRLARALRRVLPRRLGDALVEPRPPHAWKLDVPDAGDVPERLLLAATILAVEMALW